ncbi:hypothetical protein O5D80_007196 [Batrachochytrium dendrobatidis]|nr:hypothetical protein O5D80_007196 [Batrachochytrium dendrobatidis]
MFESLYTSKAKTDFKPTVLPSMTKRVSIRPTLSNIFRPLLGLASSSSESNLDSNQQSIPISPDDDTIHNIISSYYVAPNTANPIQSNNATIDEHKSPFGPFLTGLQKRTVNNAGVPDLGISNDATCQSDSSLPSPPIQTPVRRRATTNTVNTSHCAISSTSSIALANSLEYATSQSKADTQTPPLTTKNAQVVPIVTTLTRTRSTKSPLAPISPNAILPTGDLVLMCIPSSTCIDPRTSFAVQAKHLKIIQGTDNEGRQETRISCTKPNSVLKYQCCSVPASIGCCGLCDPRNWIYQGSEYNPAISRLYANMDGCIPSSVKLTAPKFIIPWRYKNRKTGAVSWKIIHMCGDNIQDAECETIVVNIYRDDKLRKLLESVERESQNLRDAELVEYILAVIQELMGTYGLPGGATSTQADTSLFNQMQQQGHNFMLLMDIRIGLCRHKALLFKILGDTTGLDCALVTGYSTGGRHQWNVVTLSDGESYIIDPTSPHFTWTKHGSYRTKAYRVSADMSFGHSGLTLKMKGVI